MGDILDRPAREIECWFDFASNYSYLSVMRIEPLARRAGLEVRWRPFLLGAIFKTFGWNTSPFVLQKEKGAYVWKDMVRQCRKYGLPWRQPSTFPRRSVLPARIALCAADESWVGEFCRRALQLNFAADGDIAEADNMAAILTELGLPAADILAASQSEANKLALRAQTDRAQALGIFGAPTFFVDGEMYWGNDRLDDALADATIRRQGVP